VQPNEPGRRYLGFGVYERVPEGFVDWLCIKNVDKDFLWMLLLVTLMTTGVFVYALV
jgi:hypothetical protein